MRPERRLKRRNGGGGFSRPRISNQTRRSITYCARKMVLTMGATFVIAQDLYALGVCLHQLLSAQFLGNIFPLPAIGRLRRHVPCEVRDVIAALLNSNPRSRPSAQLVCEVLTRFVDCELPAAQALIQIKREESLDCGAGLRDSAQIGG